MEGGEAAAVLIVVVVDWVEEGPDGVFVKGVGFEAGEGAVVCVDETIAVGVGGAVGAVADAVGVADAVPRHCGGGGGGGGR